MAESFSDIRIKEFDDAASGPSGEGALFRLVLKLSRKTPAPWAGHFNHAWKQHVYAAKRDAVVAEDNLQIVCMPEELEKDHIPELKKVIAETNQAHRKFLADRDRARLAEEDRARAQKQVIADLKKRLRFD